MGLGRLFGTLEYKHDSWPFLHHLWNEILWCKAELSRHTKNRSRVNDKESAGKKNLTSVLHRKVSKASKNGRSDTRRFQILTVSRFPDFLWKMQ